MRCVRNHIQDARPGRLLRNLPSASSQDGISMLVVVLRRRSLAICEFARTPASVAPSTLFPTVVGLLGGRNNGTQKGVAGLPVMFRQPSRCGSRVACLPSVVPPASQYRPLLRRCPSSVSPIASTSRRTAGAQEQSAAFGGCLVKTGPNRCDR